jgi:hypothetical protein
MIEHGLDQVMFDKTAALARETGLQRPRVYRARSKRSLPRRERGR